jgi:hypothetical protein
VTDEHGPEGGPARKVRLFEPLAGRTFRAIFVSVTVSGVGDWAARLALTALVYSRSHSAATSTLVFAVSMLVWVGPGQLLASLTAHLGRRRVMVGADVARAGLYALALLHLPVPLIILLVGVAALCTPPFQAARSTLMAEAVPRDRYPAAIALADMSDQSSIVAGYLLGGLVIAVGGTDVAVLINVGSFLVSAAALAFVEDHRGEPAPRTRVGGGQLRRGWQVIVGDPAIRRGLAYLSLVGAVVTAAEATSVAYSRQVLHRGAGTAGIFGACVAAAMVVTVAVVPRSGGPRWLLQVSAGIGAVICLGGGAAFGVGHLAGAVVGYVLVGVLAGTTTGAQVAFQPRIDPAVRVGVFSILQGGLQGSQGAAAALGGVLLGLLDGRSALLVVLLVPAALLTWWVLRPISDPAPPQVPPGAAAAPTG